MSNADDEGRDMYWAYLHENGEVIVKPWFGDRKDYTDDCENNPFVKKVLTPFGAESVAAARAHANRFFNGPTGADGARRAR